MSESESVSVENNVRKAASEEKAPADDKQDDGNSAAEERSDDEEPKLGLLYQALELSGSRQRKKVERLDVSFRTAARERPHQSKEKAHHWVTAPASSTTSTVSARRVSRPCIDCSLATQERHPRSRRICASSMGFPLRRTLQST
ncbi:hypothetical protein HPB49_026182 [Dermacentor silvarum]|nr:hypothetical protein HPB49_026182 [Dermacentor silvarum]